MAEEIKKGMKAVIEMIFGDIFMTFETARIILNARLDTKKADMSMDQVVGLIVALIALVAIGVGVYMKMNPNPDTVASCMTETLKIGPFG